MARANGTDGSLLSSLPWTLAALALAMAPHLPYLPVWVSISFFLCAATRWQIERKRWRLPPAWLRMALALFCFVGVLGSYQSISGVGPGSALLAIMAALKLLETRQRRDQFVLLFISIFLIMSSLLREQYLLSLPYLMIGLLLTMTAWLQMSMSRGSSARQAMRNSLRLTTYAIPIMIAMWIFFPRIATPFWAVPIDTSSGVSGLSDEMSPGDISSLSLSDAVAFRVEFDGAVPQPRDRYWRGLVLHRFNGRTWTGSEPSAGDPSNYPIEYHGEPVRYRITLEPTRQHWLFALDLPREWSLSRTIMGRQQQLARTQPIDQRIVYDAVSYTDYTLEPDFGGFFRRFQLRLPEDSNPRTVRYAEDLRRGMGSDRAFIQEVMRRFNQDEFYYTLDPPRLGRNSVDQFLFDTRRGFCEHYASAFAVMMRAAGIPARVVIGYQGGELNPMGNYLIVRQSDAHAWTEVWLEGEGWTRVDPTAAVAPERIESGMAGAMFDGIGASWGLDAPSMLLHQLTLSWDAINAMWNELILGYGPDNQTSFLEWLGMDDPDFSKMLLTLIGIVAVLLAGLTLILMWRYRPPKRDIASILYRRFVRKSGLERERGEAPLAYATRLSTQRPALADAADDITDRYLRLRYGAASPDELRDLRAAVSRFAATA